MGIVVSGEDGSLGISKEKQKVNLIAAENDYGLVMATLDQIFMFLGSWWVTSLGGRILVRRTDHTQYNPRNRLADLHFAIDV